jgi:hypothetical protein
MEWTDGSQPVRQTGGCGKWVAVSLLTYRDCRYFLCGGSEVIGGLFFLYSLREFCVDQWCSVGHSSAIVG